MLEAAARSGVRIDLVYMAGSRKYLTRALWLLGIVSFGCNFYLLFHVARVVFDGSAETTLARKRYRSFSLLTPKPIECSRGSYRIADDADGSEFLITLRDAEQFKPCRYLSPGSEGKQLANGVAEYIGLHGSSRFAFLSADGDCSRRVFRILDKRKGRFIEESIAKNCSIFNFRNGPARLAEEVAKYLEVE